MSVPASAVKELRERTGAGMMDCKRALEESGGDIERAQRLLRERGIAAAGKRAGRETTEGQVLTSRTDGYVTLIAVGCETEPVSKNDEFRTFAQTVLDAVARDGPETAASLEDERIELVARLGENIVVLGAERYERADGSSVASYVHPPAHKLGALVRLDGGTEELARKVAMHVTATNPAFASHEEVPAETTDAERKVLQGLPEVVSKPEHIRPRIVEGMLDKRFFAESVLTEQAWIHDLSLSVGEALGDARVRAFARLDVG